MIDLHNVKYGTHFPRIVGASLCVGALAAAVWVAACDSNEMPIAVGSIPGQTVHVGERATFPLGQYFSDADGDPLTFEAMSGDPAAATASVSSSSLTLTGVSQGSATVHVTATDLEGLSAEQRFTVTVPNRVPVVSDPISDTEVFVRETVEVDLSQHLVDPDGDDLAFAATSSDESVATVTVSGDTVRVVGAGQGTATVTVTAMDAGGLSAEQMFEVTVPNRAPVVTNPISDAEMFVGEAIEVSVSGNFGDPDGDDLTYAATSSDEGVATVTVSGAMVRVAGASQGTATVTVTASDPGGLSAEQRFEVTVPNRAPVAVGTMPEMDLQAGEWVEVELDDHFSDLDGDELVYTVATSDKKMVVVVVSGSVLSVHAQWRAAGTATITVTASDGDLSASHDFEAALRESLAYLVQPVQTRRQEVRVVAGREALLRVFVTAKETTTETLPPATATFYVDDEETYSVEIDGTTEPIPTEVDEGSLAKSLNIEIPASEIEEKLEMVIEIDPDSTIDHELLTATRIPENGRLRPRVKDLRKFEFTVIPFLYTEDPDSSVIDIVEDMAEDEEEYELLHEIYDLIPIREMSVEGHDAVEIDTENMRKVLDRAIAIREAEEGSGYWMGLMERPRWGIVGVAAHRTSSSIPDAFVMAHEVLHNMSLLHAPCGGPQKVDEKYPYDDGRIGVWGYDHREEEVVKPSTKDLMGYCKPKWISSFHSNKASNYRAFTEERDEEEMEMRQEARAERLLLVWGARGASGELSMDPPLVVEGRPRLPDGPGDYDLTGRDNAGNELFSISFEMVEPADAEEGTGSFVFLLPPEPGWESLASLTLSGPGVRSVVLDADSEATMAMVRDLQTGQIRAIRGDLDEPPHVRPGHVVRWTRGIPDRNAWRLR